MLHFIRVYTVRTGKNKIQTKNTIFYNIITGHPLICTMDYPKFICIKTKGTSISIQRAKGCFFSLQKARGFPAFSDGRTDSKFKLADKKILTIFHPKFFCSLFRNHIRRVAEIQIFEKTYLSVIKDEIGLKFKMYDVTLFLIGSYAQKLVASY